MAHKSHDEVFQELCRDFPGLMDYLVEGHLKEVQGLVEMVRGLGNALTSADKRVDDTSARNAELEARNDRQMELLVRIARMVDASQFAEAEPHTLVSCALPKEVATTLLNFVRPELVKAGERELGGGEWSEGRTLQTLAEMFKMHEKGLVSDKSLELAAGGEKGTPNANGDIFPSPGIAIEQSFEDPWVGHARPTSSSPQQILREIELRAHGILQSYGWALDSIEFSNGNAMRHGGEVDIRVKARSTPSSCALSHAKFCHEIRKQIRLPSGFRLDEIELVDVATGRDAALLPPKAAKLGGVGR